MLLIATAAFGLEAVVVRELLALGYEARIFTPGRILFEGDASAIAEANLHLRSASRVLVQIAEFEANDFDQLFEITKTIDWAEWIPADGQFVVNGRSIKSQLSSVPACQRTVKKAIAESLLHGHRVHELPETGATYAIEVSLLSDRATLTLDTTGPGLHKRGYRPLIGDAPIRETLAAGILQLTFWKAGRPLLDPFCGTGTIAIEAAMLGRRIAPGLNRRFIAEEWPTIDAQVWSQARQAARSRVHPNLTERIVATDTDDESLKMARRNAEAAGVSADIHFQQRDFSQTLSKREYGVLVTNPPYGERLGEAKQIEALYRTLPDVLRRLKTWSHYVLTARKDFEQLVGQPANRRRKLYNGNLECTLFQYYGPKPPRENETERTPIVSEAESSSANLPPLPAFGGLRPEAQRQAEEFSNRLSKLARHLRRWPTRRGITCFRLYDRDIPEVPLAVDRYESVEGDVYLHVAEYDRPHDRTPAEHADWLDHLAKAAGKVLDVPRERTFLKHRSRQRGADQYQKLAERQSQILVEESGLRFRVNLSDYIDTGLFLDHRITRGMVRDEAAGKRVLNLFAYTGSFTVYAAAGGAKSTTTVDLSPTYSDWAADNLRLNGCTVAEHEVIQADSREYVAALPREPLFDLAIVDPPTFSNSKRNENDWDVQQHAAELLTEVGQRLSDEGVIYFSTNSRRFKLDESQLSMFGVREISRKTVPEDFRNKRIHCCWRMVKHAIM